MERQVLHQGRLLGVVDDTVRLADGRTTHREVALHPGAVAVVAIDATGRVVMVRQWRHAIGRALWEIPAGTRDVEGELPTATAERELAEETGLTAMEWRDLGELALAPGYSTEQMHFYLAAGLTSGEPHASPDERLDVAWFTRDEVIELARRGNVDVKTLAGLALAGWNLGAG